MCNGRLILPFCSLDSSPSCFKYLPALVFAVFLLSGCAHKPTLPDYWPTSQWRSATPESQGIDSNKLAEVLTFVHDQNLPLHSLFIARRGYAVMDAYFYPFADGRRHDVASVTKSITATLVGMAVEDGSIPGLDATVLSFFPDRTVRNMDSRKRHITVANLLSMTSGFDCGYLPGERELFAMRERDDWISYALDLPMRTTPGTEFAYCSSGMHLLSAIMIQATGQPMEAYAAARLFKPLGIKQWYWPADPAGNSTGWGELQLYPRDMAKIGLLYLYQGQWEGKQIISRGWIKRATRSHITVKGKGVSYGYGWWLSQYDGKRVIIAQGRGGQRIFIWPEKKIVMVMTAGGFDPNELAGRLAQAVRSDKPLSENPRAQARLNAAVAALNQPPPARPVAPLPVIAARISGHWYRLESNSLGLEAMMFAISNKQMYMSVKVDGGQYTMPVGLDGVYRFSTRTPSTLTAGVRAAWRGDHTLLLEYDEIGRINHFTFNIGFSDKAIQVGVTEPTGFYKLKFKGVEEKPDKRRRRD
jgi:CubicO group peptidase (beta-lactamase class C family)